MSNIEMIHFERKPESEYSYDISFHMNAAKRAAAFHRSIPGYKETPLVCLNDLAVQSGVAGIYVKDESFRFGLNAFKVLGGSYCIARYIADRLQMDTKDLTYEKIAGRETKEKLGEITFVTATDGNHGRGIAWTAHMLGQKSVVFMPVNTAKERLENIRNLGAEASITDLNYDAAVKYAAECEKKYGWVLVQDTAWEGYEVIPRWIMEGYMTMAYEAVNQLAEIRPTHIFLQAGVGSMAGALTGFFADYYRGKDRPIITIVEPDKADCIFRTAKADDGKLHSVGGNMGTIMAGLACGIPCTLGWKVLSEYADNFVSMPDYVAANGMRRLAYPVGNDQKIISGESGAAGFGFLMEVLEGKDGKMRQILNLNEHSRILCVSTEGDTDKENYKRIVSEGFHEVG